MLDRNEFITGLIVGIVVPLLAWAVLGGLFLLLGNMGILPPEAEGSNFGRRTTALLAICCNLIPFTIYNKRRYTDTMRGMIFPTVAFALVWYLYFF